MRVLWKRPLIRTYGEEWQHRRRAQMQMEAETETQT